MYRGDISSFSQLPPRFCFLYHVTGLFCVLLTLYVYIFTGVHITHDLWFTKFCWVKWRFNEPFFIPTYNLLIFKYKEINL